MTKSIKGFIQYNMMQAIHIYEGLQSLQDSEQLLNLSWTLDEKDFLSADLTAFISAFLKEAGNGADYINTYLVKDPYGEAILGEAAAAYFSQKKTDLHLVSGAGVISLLHSLAKITSNGIAVIIGSSYPDFPFWVEQHGGKCLCISDKGNSTLLAEQINALQPAVVFLERPDLFDAIFSNLRDLTDFFKQIRSLNTIIIIDESNANYYPPSFSAVNIINQFPGLAVIRGFSKAYSMGGLRLAFCISSQSLTERIRLAVPPLLASSLSLNIGKKILEMGDIAIGLRERIVQQKKEVIDLFETAGIVSILAAGGYLPYVFLKNTSAYIRNQLEDKGVIGKLHPIHKSLKTNPIYVYRLSVPLVNRRMEILKSKLSRTRASV